jgi:hypothetical protein
MYRQSAVAEGDNQSTMRCLTQAEVNRYNVATVPWTGSAPSQTTAPDEPRRGGK